MCDLNLNDFDGIYFVRAFHLNTSRIDGNILNVRELLLFDDILNAIAIAKFIFFFTCHVSSVQKSSQNIVMYLGSSHRNFISNVCSFDSIEFHKHIQKKNTKWLSFLCLFQNQKEKKRNSFNLIQSARHKRVHWNCNRTKQIKSNIICKQKNSNLFACFYRNKFYIYRYIIIYKHYQISNFRSPR